MAKKPVFVENLEELDDILDEPKEKPAGAKKPSAVKDDDDDLNFDEPEKKVVPKSMAKEIPIEEDDLGLDTDSNEPNINSSPNVVDDLDDLNDEKDTTNVEIKAEACEFKIDSADFQKFLQKIELGGTIKDGYIKVENNRLYCTFNDQISQALYGFVCLPLDKGVEIIKTGSFIIQDMKKMGKIVGLFNGKIIVTYADGLIRIASTNSRKSSKVISYDKGYVDSLSGIASTIVDLEKGNIGEHNFLSGSSFAVKKESLKEILEASEAIENAEFRFDAGTENDEIMVYISNEQDRVNVPFKVMNANIKTGFKQTFSFPALGKVIKALGDDIQVFVIPAFILFKSEADFYVYMSNETDE